MCSGKIKVNYCGFIIIRWIPIFVGFVVKAEPRIQMFNEYYFFNRFCIERLAKPRNQISRNMQVFSHPRKLIPTDINESTVDLWKKNDYQLKYFHLFILRFQKPLQKEICSWMIFITVDSFVGYQFSWFSLVQVNHKFIVQRIKHLLLGCI